MSCVVLSAPPIAPAAYTGPSPPAASTADRPYIALRVVGSLLKSVQGATLGRVEEVLVNTRSGQIDFALVGPVQGKTSQLTPIPARLLRYGWDQSQIGGFPGANQVFIVKLDKATLDKAPKVKRERFLDPTQTEWQTEVLNYFDSGGTALSRYPTATSEEPEYAAGAPFQPAPQAYSSSASASSSQSTVINTTNGFAGIPHSRRFPTNAPGMGDHFRTPHFSGSTNAGGHPKPVIPNVTRLTPSPSHGGFGIPAPEGQRGVQPPPASLGPFVTLAPEGSTKLVVPPARFGPFVTLAPEGTPSFQSPPSKFGPFAISAPFADNSGNSMNSRSPFTPPFAGGGMMPREPLPPISRPPPIPLSPFEGPSTAISPPPPITPAPPLIQGRPAISPPPAIPPPR